VALKLDSNRRAELSHRNSLPVFWCRRFALFLSEHTTGSAHVSSLFHGHPGFSVDVFSRSVPGINSVIVFISYFYIAVVVVNVLLHCNPVWLFYRVWCLHIYGEVGNVIVCRNHVVVRWVILFVARWNRAVLLSSI